MSHDLISHPVHIEADGNDPQPGARFTLPIHVVPAPPEKSSSPRAWIGWLRNVVRDLVRHLRSVDASANREIERVWSEAELACREIDRRKAEALNKIRSRGGGRPANGGVLLLPGSTGGNLPERETADRDPSIQEGGERP